MYTTEEGPSNISIFSCGYCIARNHDDKIRRGREKSSPFCFQHEKQEIILHHKGSTQIITLFLFREEGRCSMRAVTMVGKRASWRYLHEGCRCDPLCTESWVKHLLVHLCLEHKTWGIFQLNILSITGYRLKPHSLIIMQKRSFSLLKVFHVKDLHTCTFF